MRESLVRTLHNLSWPLLSPAGTALPNLQTLLKEAHQHGISTLFHISRLPDPSHPRDPYWTVEEGQLPLPNIAYDSETSREIYRVFIRDLVAQLRRNSENSIHQPMEPVNEEFYQKIVDFEAELAGVWYVTLTDIDHEVKLQMCKS